MEHVETGVQPLYYGLGIILAAYVKNLQGRIGKQEKELVEYKLYVAERYASKEFLAETSNATRD